MLEEALHVFLNESDAFVFIEPGNSDGSVRVIVDGSACVDVDTALTLARAFDCTPDVIDRLQHAKESTS